MENSSIQKSKIVCALITAALLLSACAAPVSKENQLERRASERWQVLLSGDLAGAYEYLSPGYRSSVTTMQYQRMVLLQPIKWTGAKYLESNCEERRCKVKVEVDFTVYGAVPGVKSYNGSREIEESWVLVDGIWYFVPKQ